MFCTKSELDQYLNHQKQFDQNLVKTCHLDSNQTVYLQQHTLALLVELSEVANQVRFFKYWKTAKPVDHNKVLEEYIDCWRLILSLITILHFDVNELNYSETNAANNILQNQATADSKTLTNDFLTLSSFIIQIAKTKQLNADLICLFSELGAKLGLTPAAIKKAYYDKYKI